MAVPTPEPGLVVNYAYLWHYEHAEGKEEGRKDRPSVICVGVEDEQKGASIVTVLPITHRKPENEGWVIEIPAGVRGHLGLDDEPSWIVVAEGNEFLWPGYDRQERLVETKPEHLGQRVIEPRRRHQDLGITRREHAGRRKLGQRQLGVLIENLRMIRSAPDLQD